MKNYGAPVQKSVFECRLPLTKLGEMKEGLRRLIDLEEDSIRIYRICESCLQKTTIIGIGIVTEPLGPSIVT
jgi:CRISPR-associated protein Cas2